MTAGDVDGIAPIIWGPSAWLLLHCIAATYPANPTELVKRQYYTFILALGNVLPCPTCRSHYKRTLGELGFCIGHLSNRDTLFKFVFDLHNAVNQRLGKPVQEHYAYIVDKYKTLKSL
jgi:FAD-linked sulfhydryl oxidase